MSTLSLLKRLYNSALARPALARPLAAVRRSESVRRFARRRVGDLLAPGSSWSDVERAFRLIGEGTSSRVVFGPWTEGIELELLYWIPFLRWATRYANLPSARVTALSRRADGRAWYSGVAGAQDALSSGGGTVVDPQLLLGLCRPYWEQAGGFRQIAYHAVYERLPAARADAPPASGVVVVDAGGAAGSDGRALSRYAEAAARRGRGVTVLDEAHDGDGLIAIVSGAGAVVTARLDTASLGLMLGRPTILMLEQGLSYEPPRVGALRRIAHELRSPFATLDPRGVEIMIETLGPATAAW